MCLWCFGLKTIHFNRLPICLIHYMPQSKSFICIPFYLNQLPNILFDYHGLRGSFFGIFNRLRLHFNQLLIAAFGFE